MRRLLDKPLLALAVAWPLACGRPQPSLDDPAAPSLVARTSSAPLANAYSGAPVEPVAAGARAAGPLAPYPAGPWRMAQPQLRDVMLWVSHILIRYAGVTSDVSFCQAGWQASPAPARTRSEALELARGIAAQAQRGPESFAELARLRSEDEMTRERGGSLGGVTAVQLASWPQVLDALAVVRPGEVSEIVETEYGFHVLYRRAPPPEQLVSGAHIVIGHYQAPFLAQLRGAALPPRNRTQALELANDVYTRVSSDPEHFDEWVARYSEHLDTMQGGDLGQWSTREPTEYPSQVEVLSGLRVGEVSKPIETLFGWEILLRTPNRARAVYAMTPVELFANVDASAASVSSRTASGQLPLDQAKQLAQLLREHPERFEEVQRQRGTQYVVQWPEGKGWPPLMQVLQRLQPGQIAAEPIQYGLSYVIPKRVPAHPEEPRPTQFDLPSPTEPDLEYAFAALSPDVMAQQLSFVAERARTELGLTAEAMGRLQLIHEASRKDDSADPRARQDALRELQSQALALLGQGAFERYLRLLKGQLGNQLMER